MTSFIHFDVDRRLRKRLEIEPKDNLGKKIFVFFFWHIFSSNFCCCLIFIIFCLTVFSINFLVVICFIFLRTSLCMYVYLTLIIGANCFAFVVFFCFLNSVRAINTLFFYFAYFFLFVLKFALNIICLYFACANVGAPYTYTHMSRS